MTLVRPQLLFVVEGRCSSRTVLGLISETAVMLSVMLTYYFTME